MVLHRTKADIIRLWVFIAHCHLGYCSQCLIPLLTDHNSPVNWPHNTWSTKESRCTSFVVFELNSDLRFLLIPPYPDISYNLMKCQKNIFFPWNVLTNDSPVLSELQSRVSFSALSPGLGPCFIHVAMVNWSVKFCGTTQSGILAAWRPSNLKIKSLSLPLSDTRDAVQLVAVPGAGRRSVLPDEAPGVIAVGTNKRWDSRSVNNNNGRYAVCIALFLAMIT